MNVQMISEGVKLAAGIVVGKGIKNVVYKQLGWTIGEYQKPIEKAVTAIGVYAIGAGVTHSICGMIDETIDKMADGIIAIQDKLEEAKKEAGKETEDLDDIFDEDEEEL